MHTPVSEYADKFTKIWVKCFLSKRRQIVTVSKSALLDVYKFWFDGKIVPHVNFVHNYYCPKFNKDPHSKRETSLTVLTIGTLETYKNPFHFIEVAQVILKKLPNVKFIWAGDGSLMRECKERVINMPEIQFVGDINNVETLYEQATVYFQPSLVESHGIATVGAMYFGIPCVVSNNGGLKESVEDNKSGFVVPVTDENASIEKLQLLLQNDSLRKEMGGYGYGIYEKKFTKKIWETKMMDLFS